MGQENKISTQELTSKADIVIVTEASTLLADDVRRAELIEGHALPVFGLGYHAIRNPNELPSDPDIKTRLGIK